MKPLITDVTCNRQDNGNKPRDKHGPLLKR